MRVWSRHTRERQLIIANRLGCFHSDDSGHVPATMSQTVYSVAVILLGIANVVLAGIAYSQRARQLAGRTLGERQLALAARRNEMAAERVERLDQQVTLLRGIHHSIVGQRDEASDDGETVGVIDVGSTTVRMVVVRRRPGGGLKRIVDERAFLHLGAEV